MTVIHVSVPAPEPRPASGDPDLLETDATSSPGLGLTAGCPWPNGHRTLDARDATDPTTRRPGTFRDSGRWPVDIVDEWGMQSFPASDPPANW